VPALPGVPDGVGAALKAPIGDPSNRRRMPKIVIRKVNRDRVEPGCSTRRGLNLENLFFSMLVSLIVKNDIIFTEADR
jgi:hypothetical protein